MKASIRKAVTPSRRSAPRCNERRLVTQHPRRRILSLTAGAAAMPGLSRISWATAGHEGQVGDAWLRAGCEHPGGIRDANKKELETWGNVIRAGNIKAR